MCKRDKYDKYEIMQYVELLLGLEAIIEDCKASEYLCSSAAIRNTLNPTDKDKRQVGRERGRTISIRSINISPSTSNFLN